MAGLYFRLQRNLLYHPRIDTPPLFRYVLSSIHGKEYMMYALVEFKGRQYKAEKGALLKVDKIDAEPGSKLDIDSVLLLSRGEGLSKEEDVVVGNPYVAGARVSAVVESHAKDKKIIVFKYKPKKDYRRKQGHRQQYSVIKIEDIIVA